MTQVKCSHTCGFGLIWALAIMATCSQSSAAKRKVTALESRVLTLERAVELQTRKDNVNAVR